MHKLSFSLSSAILLALLIARTGFYPESEAIFFANDQATDFIVAREAVNGNWPLLGPPSHTGGRHLGPVYYWYVIAVAWVSAFDLELSTFIFTLTKVVAVLLLSGALASIFKGRSLYLSLLGLLIALINVRYSELFRVAWHSNSLIIFSGFAFFSSLSVIHRGVSYLPLFVLAQSLLFQAHLSTAPSVAGQILVISLFLCLNSTKAEILSVLRSKRFFGACILVFIFYIPMIIYELYFPSNFYNLLALHSSGYQGKTAGFYEAYQALKEFLLRHTFWLTAESVKQDPYLKFSLAAVFMPLAYGVFKQRRLRWSLCLLVFPLLVTFLLLLRFKAPLFLHYFNGSIAAPPLLLALTFGASYLGPTRLSRCLNLLIFVPAAAYIWIFSGAADRGVQKAKRPQHSLAFSEKLFSKIKELHTADHPPYIYARLHSKPVRNAYYYFSGQSHPEIDYRDFFPEIPFFTEFPRLKDLKNAYLVICPKPYRQAKREILSNLPKRWVVKAEILEKQPSEECLIAILGKKKD